MARESGSPGVGPPRQATPVVLVGTQALGQDAQMIQLYAESFAPWCEKARWALDHHRVAYRYTEHVPMVGELRLRLAARKLRGVVTVPLLVTGSGVLMDSVAIARAAEGLGGPPEKGPQTLFPEGEAQALAQWNLWSEIVMTSGRALLLGRMLRHPEAREQLPPFVPKGFRPMLQPWPRRAPASWSEKIRHPARGGCAPRLPDPVCASSGAGGACGWAPALAPGREVLLRRHHGGHLPAVPPPGGGWVHAARHRHARGLDAPGARR